MYYRGSHSIYHSVDKEVLAKRYDKFRLVYGISKYSDPERKTAVERYGFNVGFKDGKTNMYIGNYSPRKDSYTKPVFFQPAPLIVPKLRGACAILSYYQNPRRLPTM